MSSQARLPHLFAPVFLFPNKFWDKRQWGGRIQKAVCQIGRTRNKTKRFSLGKRQMHRNWKRASSIPRNRERVPAKEKRKKVQDQRSSRSCSVFIVSLLKEASTWVIWSEALRIGAGCVAAAIKDCRTYPLCANPAGHKENVVVDNWDGDLAPPQSEQRDKGVLLPSG